VISDSSKLLAMYERGVLTAPGLLTTLIESAAVRLPTELAATLPAEILLELKMRVANDDPNNGVHIWGGTLIPGVDPHEFIAEKKQAWADGVRAWRNYFGITI
jgi:hypothetical protein